jgi:GNAT superfamily N-acetyltransferase
MTFRNWTDSLNEDLSNISLDYIKTKLPKLDSYPKSDIILSKGDFVYLEIPQDVNNPYSMVYEVKVFDIKDGTLVAQSSFDYDNNNKLKGTLDVRPDKRRMGIATEIYKLAEKIIGDTIFPEEKHTEDAEKFWRQKNRSFGPQNYDSLNEVKYTNPNFELEWEEAVRYPEFKEMGKENWIKVAKQGKLVNYSSIKDVLGNVDLNFDNLEEPKKQRFQSAFKNGTVETPIAVKFSDNDYDLVAGNTRLSGLVKNGEDPKIWIVNIGSINEYDNSGPTTPKVYIVKDDGTYKEAPIELLSKISNLTYDMGGGETNYYPEKNIVIVDNIPVEEFAKEPGDIKGEKVYVEYNLNNPTSLPKANKIIASQLVYHLDNREAFAQTVANSLKDGGTFEFQSDLMNKKDKMFLQHLSDEYGFGLPTKLNQYKQESLPLKKGEFVEPIISYIYKITDKDDKTSTLSVTKKGKWWEYEKIDGDLDFKTGKFSTPPEDTDPDFRDKKYTLRTFDEYLSYFGDSNTIVDFEKLNEANKPYKHKHGFNDKLGKDPFGLNQYARELAQGLEEEVFKASKIEKLLKQKYAEVLEKLFLFEKGDYIELNLIKIRPEHKGKGWATKILDDLSEYAQENNKILTLTPSDTFGASKSRLETFYKRFGFVPNKGKNKDFTTRDAMIRPLSEDTSELFTIYLDMDGVITDFDKKFVELAGMGPREYENSFGTEKFWDFIDIKHKVKFFSEMEWMPEGKKLYDFVKQFDHKLLSAPSKNDASKIGKRIWRKNNTPDTQLILSAAVNKQNYADKSNILIDDREKNIQQWRDAGGIGILFKSTDQVIDELKKIMNL